MTDYISRKGIMKEFSDFVRASNNSDFEPTPNWNDAVSLVGSYPSADVVEVVRCKDCENYQTDWQPLSFDDGHYCAMVDTTMPYEGFCHMGERREE